MPPAQRHFPMKWFGCLRGFPSSSTMPRISRQIVRRTVRMPEVTGIALENARLMLRNAGFDPEPLLAALEAPETKAELKANTDEAIARQVFGAPAFFVDGELHWGNDRLDFVEEALRAGA